MHALGQAVYGSGLETLLAEDDHRKTLKANGCGFRFCPQVNLVGIAGRRYSLGGSFLYQGSPR